MTPFPIEGIAFQSVGISPFWILRSWYPVARRASTGNARTSEREEPSHARGLSVTRPIYTQLYMGANLKARLQKGSGLVANLPWIPQASDRPEKAERFVDKALSGSYKAADMLRSLLEFTVTATLGSHAWADQESGVNAELLKSRLEDIASSRDDGDPITMAWRWAWPPVEDGCIVFEATEVILSAEALCRLLVHEPEEDQVARGSSEGAPRTAESEEVQGRVLDSFEGEEGREEMNKSEA